MWRLPVFTCSICATFSCLAEPVLLDGLLQAAVLGQGDVVAVRSAAQPLPTFFGCFDHHMAINPQNIHRPVLAAVMQVKLFSCKVAPCCRLVELL
jgi:hypothetical protein